MANITVTKTGGVVETIYNADFAIKKIALNVNSRCKVVMFRKGDMVETNILSEHEELHTYDHFTSVNGNTVTSQDELYNQLKALL